MTEGKDKPTGTGIQPCCIEGALHPGEPKGHWGTLGPVNSYITGNLESPRAIFYMHEAFGAQLPNSQLLADCFAEALDARVYIPDFFDGSPVPLDVFSNPEARAKFDLKQFNITNSKYAREGWMRDAAKALKALPGVKTVGAVGYCWGANGLFLTADLAGEVYDACAIVHPGPLEFPKDWERVNTKAPWLYQCAEYDFCFPDEQRDESKKYLEEKGVDIKLIVYEKTIHGFATRADVFDDRGGGLAGMKKAKEDTIAFFKEHLKA